MTTAAQIPAPRPLTVRDLIRELLDHPLDSQVYIGKGMGPLTVVDSTIGPDDQRFYIVLSPSTVRRYDTGGQDG